MIDLLDDMFLALKRIGDKYYLPTKPLDEVKVKGGIVAPYLYIRVKAHDIVNGALTVKEEGGNNYVTRLLLAGIWR